MNELNENQLELVNGGVAQPTSNTKETEEWGGPEGCTPPGPVILPPPGN